MGEKHWRQSAGEGNAETVMVPGTLRSPFDFLESGPRTGIGTNMG